MKYKREVNPASVLPPDLIQGFYAGDAEAIQEAHAWLEKNGTIILFTLQKISGDELVWYDETEGKVFVGSDKMPHFKDLRRWLTQIDPSITRASVGEGWSRKKVFEELSRYRIGG